eukprot:7229027-Prymnesium_polylepis.1
MAHSAVPLHDLNPLEGALPFRLRVQKKCDSARLQLAGGGPCGGTAGQARLPGYEQRAAAGSWAQGETTSENPPD